jgi:hypothetical protein
MANGNSNGRILWWLISGLTGLVLGIGSHQLTDTANQGQKIAILEHQAVSTEHRLRAIENKLDKILEHQRRQP